MSMSKFLTVFVSVLLIEAAFHPSFASSQCASQLGGLDRSTPEMRLSDRTFQVDDKGRIKISAELGSLFLKAAESQRNSTTGNRSELKRTVPVESLKTSLQKLGQTFSLQARDSVAPGTKNVTVTEYLNILNFPFDDKSLGVKIRFRKYGTIDQSLDNRIENVRVIPALQEVSWVEFKIDHPDFENSVLKPRALMRDADIAKIGTPAFTKSFDQILDQTVRLNAKSQSGKQTALEIQKVLMELHAAQVPLKKDSQTIYERTSFAIPVENPIAGKVYEIQITIDEGILLFSYPHQMHIDAYKSEKPLTVVEVKIPVEMLDSKTQAFKEELLAQIPSLSAIQTFINDLTTAQAPGYTANKGKQSLIKDLIKQNKSSQ